MRCAWIYLHAEKDVQNSPLLKEILAIIVLLFNYVNFGSEPKEARWKRANFTVARLKRVLSRVWMCPASCA